jgi:putative inorganic carbon (HCO3(-)) transporter
MRTRLSLTAWRSTYPLFAVALCAPFLVFPTVAPVLGALSALVVLAVWLARGRAARTGFEGALIALLAAALIGWWAAPDPLLGLARAGNLLLDVTVFDVLARTPWLARRPRLWLWALAFAAAGVALAGLLGADWNTYKYPLLRPLYGRLPHLLALPGAAEGLAPNEVAGVLATLFPAMCALVWSYWNAGNGKRGAGLPVSRFPLPAYLSLGCLAFVAAVLVLTQARLALAAAGIVSVIALGRVLGRPRAGLGMALAMAVVAVWAVAGGSDVDTTLAGRLEVWQRGLWTLRDFPLTGAGLGAWPAVAGAFYGFPYWGTRPMGHPHDWLLSAGAEMGVPGLLAALALAAACVQAARRALAREAGGDEAALRYAAIGGLGAFALFGLADAIALGGRGGLVVWLLMGILAALSRSTDEHRLKHPAAGVALAALAGLALLAYAGPANLGLVALNRALWYRTSYALSTADRTGVAQAATMLDADQPGALRGRGFAYAALGDTPQALDAWRRAGVPAEQLLAWGLAAAARADAAGAGDAAVWEREALDWYARAEAFAPPGSRTHMFRALIQVRMGDSAAAIASLEQALALDRDWLNARERLSALVLLGTLRLQAGDYAGAEVRLSQAVTEYAAQVPARELAGTYSLLGRARWAQGEAAAALDAYGRAATAEPDSGWRAVELAVVQYDSGDPDAARATWAEMLARLGLQDDWQLASWASVLARHGDAAALEAACAQVPAAQRDAPGARLCSALLDWNAGRASAALIVFGELVQQLPRDPLPAYWEGRALLAMQKPAAAAGPLEAAVARAPDDAPAWEALGDARASLGDLSGARAAYQRALALRPGDGGLQAKIEGLP